MFKFQMKKAYWNTHTYTALIYQISVPCSVEGLFQKIHLILHWITGVSIRVDRGPEVYTALIKIGIRRRPIAGPTHNAVWESYSLLVMRCSFTCQSLQWGVNHKKLTIPVHISVTGCDFQCEFRIRKYRVRFMLCTTYSFLINSNVNRIAAPIEHPFSQASIRTGAVGNRLTFSNIFLL